jgi:hypothetical protein
LKRLVKALKQFFYLTEIRSFSKYFKSSPIITKAFEIKQIYLFYYFGPPEPYKRVDRER